MTDFGEIYAENFSGVYKYVLALCRNEDIAEEVTQETFFKGMRHIDKFNGSCKLYVWLCQIAKNTYFSLSKKRKRMALGIGGDFTYTTSDLEKDYLDKDAARRLHVLIHNLNEPYKFAVTTQGILKELDPLLFGQWVVWLVLHGKFYWFQRLL